MIRRHSLSAVCMHWFNAFCWIALLFTGFALLSNPAMQPVGMWWADLWTGVFGAYGLLVFHLLIGSAWLAVYFLYIIFGLRHDVVPFLKEVFSLSPASDMIWCVRKGMRLVLGEKAMRSMGLDPTLPPQGFYNAGQKLAAVAAVLCSVGLALSGLFLAALAPSRRAGLRGRRPVGPFHPSALRGRDGRCPAHPYLHGRIRARRRPRAAVHVLGIHPRNVYPAP